jgi:adenylosuccinate synthase
MLWLFCYTSYVKHPNVTAVVGGQWGDEGKGKIVDYLATRADVVIRSQGGDNAGHTVLNKKGKFGLHLIPAGIFNPKTLNIIGAGVALNPRTLMKEITELQAKGVKFDNLVISPKSHLAFDYHLFIDQNQEEARGARRIETTKRGIGPTYMDKAERVGIQTRLLLQPDQCLAQLDGILTQKRKYWGKNDDVFQVAYYEDFIKEASRVLKGYIQDTEPLIEKHLEKGSRFVLEGAHGALLDLDHGTYPMVTASNSTVGGLLVGAGMPPLALTQVIGVFKAYQTRVGAGAMPTELQGEIADSIRTKGHEFGTTTGRPRRIGFFDGVAARYAHRINGFTDIAITKIDTLADTTDPKICTAYKNSQGKTTDFQTSNDFLADCTAEYQTFTGWSEKDIANATTYQELPDTVQNYCSQLVASMPGAKLRFIGVGQARDQLIVC